MYIIPEGSCLLGCFILARRSWQLTPGSKSARSSCDCLLREAMAYPDVSVSKIQVMYGGRVQQMKEGAVDFLPDSVGEPEAVSSFLWSYGKPYIVIVRL